MITSPLVGRFSQSDEEEIVELRAAIERKEAEVVELRARLNLLLTKQRTEASAKTEARAHRGSGRGGDKPGSVRERGQEEDTRASIENSER